MSMKTLDCLEIDETKKNVVPWYNPQEFIKVYELLYKADITSKRKAIEQISVWETRCHPSLPTAIEASSLLTRAIIQDALNENGTTLFDVADIQTFYSMALVKFVNLSVELYQPYYKLSNAFLAQGLGIPSWIVDLRNDATHTCIPPLSLLRMGAQEAMKYLDRNYWSIESKKHESIINEPKDLENFKSLILNFQIYYYKLNHSKEKTSEEYVGNKKELKRICTEIIRCLRENKKEFIEALVMDEIFIWSEDILKRMLTKQERKNFFLENMEATETEDINEEDMNCRLPILPKSIQNFWYPLINIINRSSAIPDLMIALLETQAKRDSTGQRLLASWVIKILRFAINPVFEDSKLSKAFQKKPPIFDWEQLLFAALYKPCIYTPYIFPLIACQMDVDKQFVISMSKLLAIYLGEAIPNPETNPIFKIPENLVAFTVDKVKQIKRYKELKIGKKVKLDDVWQVAPDDLDFENMPIGYVIESSSNESEIISKIWNDFAVQHRTGFLWNNKNDEDVDVEDFTEVEQNALLEDKKLIHERQTFLYKN